MLLDKLDFCLVQIPRQNVWLEIPLNMTGCEIRNLGCLDRFGGFSQATHRYILPLDWKMILGKRAYVGLFLDPTFP